MNCMHTRDLLPNLLFGDMKPDEAAELEKHLATCLACRQEYAALKGIRQGLDTLPVPAVQVDLPRVYQQAAQRRQQQARRWRRVAAALLAAAATVLLALFLNLEIRAEGHQLIVRWGKPPETAAPAPAPQPSPPTIVPVQPSVASIPAEELQLLKDLIHALATDAKDRDKALAQLQIRLDVLQAQSNQRWADTQRTNRVFYTALFGPRDKGGNP